MSTNPYLNGKNLVQRMDSINAEIDRAYQPYMTDLQREAKTVADEVEKGVRHLHMSAQFAQGEAEGGDGATLLTWDGQLLDVPEE